MRRSRALCSVLVAVSLGCGQRSGPLAVGQGSFKVGFDSMGGGEGPSGGGGVTQPQVFGHATLRGQVFAYPATAIGSAARDTPAQGVPVWVRVRSDAGYHGAERALTDASGQYAVTLPLHCDPASCRYDAFAHVPGSNEASSVTSAGIGLGETWLPPIERAPTGVSEPNALIWARRYGPNPVGAPDATTPVFFVSGFDPGYDIKSGPEAIDPSLTTPAGDARQISVLDLIRGSRLSDRSNLLEWMKASGFTLYVISMGHNSQRSIRDLAPEAMALVERLRRQYHPDKQAIVGGYSMGGVVTSAGLKHWCAGNLPGLEAGCPTVAMAFFGDAPLQGATIPMSMQRYVNWQMYDSAWSEALGVRSAAELLVRTVVGRCETNCGESACDSFNGDPQRRVDDRPYFSDGCTMSTAVHDDFQAWAGGRPRRGAGADAPLLPAVTLALGSDPRRAYYAEADGSHRVYARVSIVKWLGPYFEYSNQYLQWNTAWGTGVLPHDEHVPGSTLTTLSQLDGTSQWQHALLFGGGGTLEVEREPTFIPTRSALDWDGTAEWFDGARHQNPFRDYWFNDHDATHATTLPTGAARMLAAWFSEFGNGARDRPVCGHPVKTPGMRVRQPGYGINYFVGVPNCRPAIVEDRTNGIDDDGDDLVDESPQEGHGDGYCDPTEQAGLAADGTAAPEDCGDRCGDGYCTGEETESSCPAECAGSPCPEGTYDCCDDGVCRSPGQCDRLCAG